MSNMLLSRQAELISIPDDFRVLVLGCGSIGSNAIHMLWSMGVYKFTVIDADDVAPENIYPGHFHSLDIGTPKVTAVEGSLLGMIDGLPPDMGMATNALEFEYDKYRGMFVGAEDLNGLGLPHHNIAISCTDNLHSRKSFWESRTALDFDIDWVIDARMGGPVATVRTVPAGNHVSPDWAEAIHKYEMSLDPEGEAELPCGMKATAPLTKGWINGMIGKSAWNIIKGIHPLYYQRYSLDDGLYFRQQ